MGYDDDFYMVDAIVNIWIVNILGGACKFWCSEGLGLLMDTFMIIDTYCNILWDVKDIGVFFEGACSGEYLMGGFDIHESN